MGRVSLVLASVLATLAALPGAPAPAGEPLRERVEVRVVLLDVLATDAAGRTVPDLLPDEFSLLVDSRLVPVDSVDVTCPAGAVDEPRMVDRAEDRDPPAAGGPGRRLVLAIDYLHLAPIERGALIASLRDAVPRLIGPGDEAMVVAIANDVRVEQPFTGDAERIVATLSRMRDDITLWAPAFDRLTEYGFFEKLERLLVVLQALPGPEALVLYSNHPGRSDELDPQFAAVASAATAARVAIYPVHAAGLQAPNAADPTANLAGGPRLLARLATDSGGRMTRNTNDMSLGLARARRDLGCRYTLGFRDDRPIDPDERRVVVRVTREGVRLHHPDRYAFRTPDDERDALAQAALAAPEAFARGDLRASAVPWLPVDERRWEVLIVVDVPADAGATLTTELTRPTAVVDFHATRTLDGLAPAEPGGTVRLAAAVRLRPGRYRLAAVATGAAGPPRAAVLRLDVPEAPRDRPFLVGPVVGAPVGAAVRGLSDDRSDADPALAGGAPLPDPTGRFVAGAPLVAAARACAFNEAPGAPVLRLRAEVSGAVVGPACRLEGRAAAAGSGRVLCTELTAPVDPASLPSGEWLLTAESGELRSSLRFRTEETR